jgi:protein SCO1/2
MLFGNVLRKGRARLHCRRLRSGAASAFVTLLLVLSTSVARAQTPSPTQTQTGNPANAAQLPEALKGVGIDQRLGASLPLSVGLRDEEGREVQLGDYFGGRPVILALVYYECPMLCTLELNGLLKAIRVLPLTLGDDYQIVTVSFDPGETPELARKKREEYLSQYKHPGAERGWHFLTGDAESIRQVTEAAGFQYTYDPKTDLFAHGSAIMVATPEGKLSRYYYGIEYSPRDLRLGLVEASRNEIGSFVDQVLLFCFHYDPVQGKYSLAILNTLRAAGVVTVLAIVTFLWIMLRREHTGNPHAAAVSRG